MVQEKRTFDEEVREVMEQITREENFADEPKFTPSLFIDVVTEPATTEEVKRQHEGIQKQTDCRRVPDYQVSEQMNLGLEDDLKNL